MDWRRYVPAHIRAAWPDDDDGLNGLVLLSTSQLGRVGARLQAPVIEVTATRGAILAGVLRACRSARALAVVSVPFQPRQHHPQAAQVVLAGVRAAAQVAGLTGPLFVVASPDDGATTAPVERVADRLGRELEAGYGGVGIGAAELFDVDGVAELLPQLSGTDVGLELAIPHGMDAAFLLAQIDDAGIPVSAVRGAGVDDELGRASRVVPLSLLDGLKHLDDGGLRIVIDETLRRAHATDDDEDAEAQAFFAAARVIKALSAEGTRETFAAELPNIDDDETAPALAVGPLAIPS